MTEGTFFSRAWPSIVALVGTVAVVVGLLFLFGDDGSGSDNEAAAEDGTVSGGETTGDDPATTEPDAEQTGDGEDTGDGETSGESEDGGDGEDGENPDEAPATPVDAPPELRTPVGILNSTDITGLAAGAQERFIDGGWDVPATTNYSGEVEGTTAYYPAEDLQASAEALAAQFPEIRFVEPTPTDQNLARERILVILANDYAEAVGATEESG